MPVLILSQFRQAVDLVVSACQVRLQLAKYLRIEEQCDDVECFFSQVRDIHGTRLKIGTKTGLHLLFAC